MKRILCLLLTLCLMLPVVAMADGLTVVQAQTPGNDARGFAEITLVLEGDVIVAAYINEYQVGDAATFAGVPNSDAAFGENLPEGQVLFSKRTNNDAYSANMTAYAGATHTLAEGYAAIEAFVVGKTLADLEAAVEGYEDSAALLEADVVSGSTLTGTMSYIQGIISVLKGE